MKTIVMLTCPRAEDVCTGAGCFAAFYGRTHQFARYGKEELQVGAFMKCSGCGHYPGKDRGLDEKIGRVISLHPAAVHIGICTCHCHGKGGVCPEVEAICDKFRTAGIPVVRGTHSVF